MAKNLEIEAKFLLNKEDFDKIVAHFLITDFFSQTNYYFDTTDFKLISSHCAMRIRHTAENEYEATTKVPSGDGLIETNVIVPYATFNSLINDKIIIIDEIEKVLNTIGLSQNNLHFFAKLTTKRATTKYKIGELFFDESTYFDKTDYEIEYEVSTNLEEANNILFDLFKELNITSYHKGYSKIKRCIDYKKNKKM